MIQLVGVSKDPGDGGILAQGGSEGAFRGCCGAVVTPCAAPGGRGAKITAPHGWEERAPTRVGTRARERLIK